MIQPPVSSHGEAALPEEQWWGGTDYKGARSAALKANRLAYPLKGTPTAGNVHKAIEAHKVAGSLATKPAEKAFHERSVTALGKHAAGLGEPARPPHLRRYTRLP